MKIRVLLLPIVVALILVSCGKSAITKTKIETNNDTLSYAFGINIYFSLMADSIVLDPAIIAKAMTEAAKDDAIMDEDMARSFIYAYINEREQKRIGQQAELNKELYKDLIAEGDSFLQKNKEADGVIVTPSGLQYKVVKMGTGAKPSEEDVVRVHYTGTLIDGSKFDSSVDRGEPAEFMVNGVIKGWVEALQLMPVGSKFILYIPSDLAYGGNGAGDVIKPYSTLIFEVELLDIVKQ
jgi:FKBP-type peptidyl-prolyl cis-trans isomerase